MMTQVLRLAAVFIMFSVVLAMHGCTTMGPVQGSAAGDHEKLAKYYADQALEFKGKAQFWDNKADAYEHHPELDNSTNAAEQAAYCREVAQNYRKMADEAAALASTHENLTRRGQGP
ncbi:MAG: hypothetical protein P0120_04665 [Nitrospira sp.]|nr:hypothetical protein [Nitrospira sp.]